MVRACGWRMGHGSCRSRSRDWREEKERRAAMRMLRRDCFRQCAGIAVDNPQVGVIVDLHHSHRFATTRIRH